MSWKVAMGSWKSWITVGFYAIWLRMGTRYRVTEEKVTAEYGILSKNSTTINLQDIRNVELSQSGLERLLGYGDIAFSTAGTGGTEITFNKVPKPNNIKQRVEEARRTAE